jgi:methionyl aminopeptidase
MIETKVIKNKQKILKAGKIASEVKKWIKPQIKKGTLLLEIAEKIESKIIELGGKPAFPTNLSINEIAAHYTPSYDDKKIAEGLLKIDFGVHIDGWIADTAFSIDLENNEENKKLIEASEKGLQAGIEKIREKKSLGEIGESIQKAIESFNFSPIINLTGHEMNQYELHSGIAIYNIKNSRSEKLSKGLYAVEPFATNGSRKIYEGKPSEIYILKSDKNVRNSEARKLLNFIIEEYKTLPFCSRWIVKKFGTKSFLLLKQLEMNGNIYNYPQLIESSKCKVAQTENTILIDDEIIVTSE